MSAKKKPNKDVDKKTSGAEEQQALTEAELQQVKEQTRPGMGKMFGVTIALAALGGGALAGGLAVANDAPQRADYAISTEGDMEITSNFTTEIHNPDGVLSQEDEARMERDVERLETPAVV